MKILWIEDNSNNIINMIFENEMFNVLFTDSEIEKLKELQKTKYDGYDLADLLESFNNSLYVVSSLIEAYELIKKVRFDKFILDIKFPLGRYFEYDMEKMVAEIMENQDLSFHTINQERYMGIVLNHLIVTKYEKEYGWNQEMAENNIRFLTGNNENINSFISKTNFKYNPTAKSVILLDKNNIKDFNKLIVWIESF